MTAGRVAPPSAVAEPRDASMKGTFVKVLFVQALTLTALWLFQEYFSR